VKSQRPKVEPIRKPNLLPWRKWTAADPQTSTIERPTSLPGILLGTSLSVIIPANAGRHFLSTLLSMNRADFLPYYANQFCDGRMALPSILRLNGCPSLARSPLAAPELPEDFIFLCEKFRSHYARQSTSRLRFLIRRFREKRWIFSVQACPVCFQFPSSFDRWKIPEQTVFLAVFVALL